MLSDLDSIFYCADELKCKNRTQRVTASVVIRQNDALVWKIAIVGTLKYLYARQNMKKVTLYLNKKNA